MTWEDVQVLAFGRLGMSQVEFWVNTSLCDLRLKSKGFYELENERQQQEWERTRWQTWVLLNIHIDSKKRLKTPTDLMPFPWEDSGKEIEILDKEEQKRRFSKMDRYMKQKYGKKGS